MSGDLHSTAHGPLNRATGQAMSPAGRRRSSSARGCDTLRHMPRLGSHEHSSIGAVPADGSSNSFRIMLTKLTSFLLICLVSALGLAGPARADVEPNNGIHQPEGPLLAGTYDGKVDSANDRDWYAFYVGSPGIVKVTVTNIDDASNCSIGADWRKTTGVGIASFLAYENQTDEYTYTVAEPGRFLLEVRGGGCVGNQYRFSITGAIVSGPGPATPTPTPDTNDTAEAAFGPLSGDTRYTARTDSANDKDWFYFHVAGPGGIAVDVTNVDDTTTCRVSLRMEMLSGRELGGVSVDENRTERITYTAPAAMTLRLTHTGSCTGNEYEFMITPAAALTAVAPPPDADFDGVVDAADACRDEVGVAPSGCPDRDGDGIADSADRCAETAGVAPSGCPDRDRDGVPDSEDKCQSTPGVAPRGCPVRVRYTTTVVLRRKGRTYRGKVTSTGKSCVFRRKVVLRRVGKGTRSYGVGYTRQDGTFTIRARRGTRGRIYAIVAERTTTSSLCSVRRSAGLQV